MGKKCEKVKDGKRCIKCAVYGKEGGNAVYCKEHKDELVDTESYIDVIHKRCLGENCKMSRIFGPIGGKPLYSEKHSEKKMIKLINKKCNTEGCKIQAYYGYIIDNKPIKCLQHKDDKMIDVKSSRCIETGCKFRPLFNKLGETKPLYCSEHIKYKLGMINIVGKCKDPECEKSAIYGEIGKSPQFCKEHNIDGLSDLVSKKCIISGCKKSPSYNYSDKNSPIYCAQCARNHIDFDKMIDVKHSKCKYDGCDTIPTYGIHGKEAIYCSEHKNEENGLVDVKHKTCLSEWCNVIVKGKYNGYCLFCYINLFPDKLVTRNYKTKEKSVSDYILESFPEYGWIMDKRIVDGCSNRRPDLLLDLGEKIIIVEVDENQHTDYNCSCENKRLMEISKDLGHRNIIFIRFNPDDYKDKNCIKIKSCWKQNKNGLLQLDDKDDWNNRLKNLNNQIQYWINNNSDKMIEIIQLYYDQT